MSWHETFFTGLVAESVRRIYPDAFTQTQADFILGTLAPTPGDKLLDIPCGAGRLSLAIARKGFHVHGIDIAGELLDHAWNDAELAHLPASFQRHDMRQPLTETFAHAFSMGNSFAYFDDAGNQAFLQAVFGALKPGGSFLLETNLAAESILPQPLGKRWYQLGDLLFLHDSAYDPFTSTLTSSYHLIRGTETEQKQAHYRIYPCRTILELFRAAGFTIQNTFGTLQRGPYHLGCPSLYIHARRPA